MNRTLAERGSGSWRGDGGGVARGARGGAPGSPRTMYNTRSVVRPEAGDAPGASP